MTETGIVRFIDVLVAMIRACYVIAIYVDRLYNTEAYLPA